MTNKDYSRGYALALFALAKEENKFLQYKKDAQDIIKAFTKNNKYLLLLISKKISFKEKQQLIWDALKKINIYFQNLIFILIKKSKLKIINYIFLKLITYINRELNISEGIIYSVEKLTTSQIQIIETSIYKKSNLKIELKNLIDKSLILGIKVVIKDKIIEDTAISRLEQIKKQLIGGAI